MRHRRARVGFCLAVVLFFAWRGTVRAEETPDASREELQVVLETLRTSNEDLKQRLDQREAMVRKLQESLAVARTESDLFQRKWEEAQLRAQTLGVNFGDADATQSQRQLIESVRSLYLAEAERQRLAEQLKRLVTAVQSNRDVVAEVDRTKALLAATEPRAAADGGAGSSTLESARVLEVNPKLQLVVLDIGGQQGVRIGMPFLVLRGDRVIGQVRVVEARKRICGALIENVEQGVTIAAGDGVRATRG